MSESIVRKIREEEAPTVEVPAIGCSFTTNLGGDRQIVLQTHFAWDMSDEAINGQLDRMLKIGDRQKAKYDLEKLEDEFRTLGNAIVDMIAAIPVAERNHAKEEVERAERLEVLHSMQQAVRDQAYEEFTKAGKRGSFVLKGHALSRFNGIGAEIAKLEEREKTVVNDRSQWKQTQATNIDRFRQDLTKRRLKLNSLRALAGMEPNREFEEAEMCPVVGL